MEFIDRKEELRRLDSLLSRQDGGLGVIYGRRRIGKSFLLTHWCSRVKGIYVVCELTVSAVQRRNFASSVALHFTGFDLVEYPSWSALFSVLSQRASQEHWHGPLIIDEFPYLAAADATLTGILQNWIDGEVRTGGILTVLAGSSQRMMQGLILEHSSPLYGRANVLFCLQPLDLGYIWEALHLKTTVEAIKNYALWGGVPRYWHEAEALKGLSFEDRLDELVLSPLGIFHEEPNYLLHTEVPSAEGLRPYLDVVAQGAHRISEIASRLQMAVTALSRPMSHLQELGLVKREIPFGESERSSKRSLYKISDPFCRMWFQIVSPNRSLLDNSTRAQRLALWSRYSSQIIAREWEELARQYIHRVDIVGELAGDGEFWRPASRWWQENHAEWDLVSTNLKGNKVLLGEVKWSENKFSSSELRRLTQELLNRERPQKLDGKLVFVLVVPDAEEEMAECNGVLIVTAEKLMAASLE